MKACVLHAVGDLRYEDVPNPEPREGEVLLEIRASGICGSDIARVYTKGTYRFPTIPGHEFAGEIVETGKGVSSSYLGLRAAVFPLIPCRMCDMCEVGEYASRRNYNYFGSRCDGGFAERIAVPVWNLVLADQTLSFEEAAMVEPAAVALHALNRARIRPGDWVAVYGAGPIGLMVGEFAKIAGASNVILVDIDDRKLAFARSLGYQFALNSTQSRHLDEIMQLTSGKGVDLAVECAGVSAAYAACLRCVKPQGDVVLMGNPAADLHVSQQDYWEVLRKQLTLFGTWNSSYSKTKNDWQTAIGYMNAGKLNVKPFITHRFGLESCNEAFTLVRDKTEFYNKVMFINH